MSCSLAPLPLRLISALALILPVLFAPLPALAQAIQVMARTPPAEPAPAAPAMSERSFYDETAIAVLGWLAVQPDSVVGDYAAELAEACFQVIRSPIGSDQEAIAFLILASRLREPPPGLAASIQEIREARNTKSLTGSVLTRYTGVRFAAAIGVDGTEGVGPEYSVGLGTSLMGEAVGSGIQQLGLPVGLANYFKESTELGFSVPLRKRDQIDPYLSAAIGEFRPSGKTVIVVLGFEQIGAEDERVAGVAGSNGTAESFSRPFLGIGMFWGTAEELKQKVQDGKAVPVLAAGIGLPFYREGNIFGALGALFTDANDFDRSGEVSFSFSLNVALPSPTFVKSD